MTPRKRMAILLAFLAIATGLAASENFFARARQPVRAIGHARTDLPASTTNTPATEKNVTDSGASMTIHPIRERHAAADKGEAFTTKDWTPPPPPPPPPAPPPPPSAPQLPFVFVGKQFKDGEWSVFLASQQFGNQIVRKGDVIENTYRVEAINPPTLQLTYLPLKQAQQLAIGIAK